MDKSMSQHNLLPTVFVIFGATGDLMQSKLAPALFRLHQQGLLPKMFQVVGFARKDLTNEAFQRMVVAMLEKKVKAAKEELEQFVKYFAYQQGLFEELSGYDKLAEFMGRRDKEWKVCANKLFYLAVPPQFYKTLFQNLSKSGLAEPCSPEEGWTRVIVEKPFGKDFKTAKELDKLLEKLFKEEQIYRIDHYLGKETVQNILAFRFSNSFLQDSWDKKAIESIVVRLLEKDGVGRRGGFYDGIGALRDVGQNHMLQLLALFAMENPGAFDGNTVRQKRAEVLQSIRILKTADVRKLSMRGQYQGYRAEKNIGPNSQTETYFRLKMFIDNPRWDGVPVYLEGGKAMDREIVEVLITFKHPSPCLCPSEQGKHYKNIVHYRIQPYEGIDITFWAKKPGPEMVLEEKSFSFDYPGNSCKLEICGYYHKGMGKKCRPIDSIPEKR
ncbi:MAG: glucose-6-phosphate dehydrogenase [Candidatus Wildermuthbacteria bacterium]|nr:glucose-6-phosphate dehydrogenase [Candidatus Wildermuthbacteria bacterium]